MNKVWVIQEGKNDYSSAENYGEVNFVTRSDYRTTKGSQQNATVISDIARFRTDYIAGMDYIILAGNPIVTALVVMSLVDGNHRFLKWDGRRSEYIPFTLNRELVA